MFTKIEDSRPCFKILLRTRLPSRSFLTANRRISATSLHKGDPGRFDCKGLLGSRFRFNYEFFNPVNCKQKLLFRYSPEMAGNE